MSSISASYTHAAPRGRPTHSSRNQRLAIGALAALGLGSFGVAISSLRQSDLAPLSASSNGTNDGMFALTTRASVSHQPVASLSELTLPRNGLITNQANSSSRTQPTVDLAQNQKATPTTPALSSAEVAGQVSEIAAAMRLDRTPTLPELKWLLGNLVQFNSAELHQVTPGPETTQFILAASALLKGRDRVKAKYGDAKSDLRTFQAEMDSDYKQHIDVLVRAAVKAGLAVIRTEIAAK